MREEMILGFDISTSYLGYCLLGDLGEYINLGHLDLRKYKSLYEKADIFHEFINDFKVSELSQDDFKIYVEAPLARSNNQNVVNLLQRWNGMCCEIIYRTFEQEPELIEHRTARKLVGIKIAKGLKGHDLKKYILQYVQSLCIIPEDKWELKRTGNPKDWCFDQADAFVIAKAGIEKDNNDG